jgi:glyoxylase-like metal-dependent hydrolase (beta-lactamase superfamily II)
MRILIGYSLATLLAGCTVPMLADKAEFHQFAAAPRPGRAVQVVPMIMASKPNPRCAAAGEAPCWPFWDMVHTSYLIVHPQGNLLIDAGLGERAGEDLARFPPLQRAALKSEPRGKGSLKASLAALGNPPIRYVVLTHVHWDHTSGLRDLDRPNIIVSPEDKAFVDAHRNDTPPLIVMPDHLDGGTLTAVTWDGPPVENFAASHDLYGDGSVVFVPLPGHTPGSMGVLVTHGYGHRFLFVGDCVWSVEAAQLPSHKAKLMSDVADFDTAALSGSIWRLHDLLERDPNLILVPTHDGGAYERVSALVRARH